MRKSSLLETKVVTSAATVDEAARYAHRLVGMRSRGSGDRANAIERVARECGVPKGAVWALLYRKPKRVWADVLQNLRNGYVAACEAQLRALQHEITITKALAGADSAAVREAEALLAAAVAADAGASS